MISSLGSVDSTDRFPDSLPYLLDRSPQAFLCPLNHTFCQSRSISSQSSLVIDRCANYFALWPNSKIGLTRAHVKTTRLCDSFRYLTSFRMPPMVNCPDLRILFRNVTRTVRLLVNTCVTWPLTRADSVSSYTALTTKPSPTSIKASVAV